MKTGPGQSKRVKEDVHTALVGSLDWIQGVTEGRELSSTDAVVL